MGRLPVTDGGAETAGSLAAEAYLDAAGRRVLEHMPVGFIGLDADWDTGMASSLRAGLAGLAGRADAALVLLVDMPGMTPAALERMAGHAGPGALAVATYDGVRGHPVLLGRDHWAGVARTATGDEGARRYLGAHETTEVDCTGLADPADLDVPPGRPG